MEMLFGKLPEFFKDEDELRGACPIRGKSFSNASQRRIALMRLTSPSVRCAVSCGALHSMRGRYVLGFVLLEVWFNGARSC
jgi:hypothetical protein